MRGVLEVLHKFCTSLAYQGFVDSGDSHCKKWNFRVFGLLNPSAHGARIRSGRVYEVFAFGAFGILYIQA